MSVGFVITKKRMRDVFPGADGRANPWLWFAYRAGEMEVCGVKTLKECERMIDEIIADENKH